MFEICREKTVDTDVLMRTVIVVHLSPQKLTSVFETIFAFDDCGIPVQYIHQVLKDQTFGDGFKD